MTTKKKSKVPVPPAQKRSAELKKHSELCTLNSALPTANVEAAIADMEAAISRLQDSGSRQAQSSKSKVPVPPAQLRSSKPNPPPLTPRPSPLPKVKLATPVIDYLTVIGSHFMRVSWSPVADADGYLLKWSTESTLANAQVITVGKTVTSTTLSGLLADTLYYIRIQALAAAGNTDSDFSVLKSARTASLAEVDSATVYLQAWLIDLRAANQTAFAMLPEIEQGTLTPAERRRRLGSGVRRYGYIDKVSDTAVEFPQFWPAYFDDASSEPTGAEKLKELLREIEVLRNLLMTFESGSRAVLDRLLTAGDEAFRIANIYYASVRTAARHQIPDAEAVFRMLQLFWRRRRNTPAEPTEPEIERDVRALLHGTKDGEVIVRNESDKMTKGEKVVIDDTRQKPKGGMKSIETEKVE